MQDVPKSSCNWQLPSSSMPMCSEMSCSNFSNLQNHRLTTNCSQLSLLAIRVLVSHVIDASCSRAQRLRQPTTIFMCLLLVLGGSVCGEKNSNALRVSVTSATVLSVFWVYQQEVLFGCAGGCHKMSLWIQPRSFQVPILEVESLQLIKFFGRWCKRINRSMLKNTKNYCFSTWNVMTFMPYYNPIF